jgi:hypothetical protein
MARRTPNAELAYKVLDHIDAHPEQWNQGVYIGSGECGTVGCFAGWTVLLSGAEPLYRDGGSITEMAVVDGRPHAVADLAEDLLGASRYVDQSDYEYDGEYDGFDLFSACNTRENLDRLVFKIFGPRPGAAS